MRVCQEAAMSPVKDLLNTWDVRSVGSASASTRSHPSSSSQARAPLPPPPSTRSHSSQSHVLSPKSRLPALLTSHRPTC